MPNYDEPEDRFAELRAQLAAATAQRDELLRAAKHAEAFVWGEEGVAMLERKVPSQEWVREFHNRRDALRLAIANAERAQSGQPASVQQPSSNDVAIQGGECSFFDQLPKGPALGRFSASERAELDDLKRKAFKAGEP